MPLFEEKGGVRFLQAEHVGREDQKSIEDDENPEDQQRSALEDDGAR